MEWRAHITPAFEMFGDRVVLFRSLGNLIEIIEGFDADGVPQITRYEPTVTPPRPAGILLPAGSLAAIVEAVKPGPSTSELKVLTDALTIERARVDKVIDSHLGT